MQRVKALIGVLLVIALAYAGWMLLPPYLANFQFQDAIDSEARLSSYSSKSEQDIHETIFKKAIELEIPVRREDIRVVRNGTEVVIIARYQVHVELPGYPLDLRFNPKSKSAERYRGPK